MRRKKYISLRKLQYIEWKEVLKKTWSTQVFFILDMWAGTEEMKVLLFNIILIFNMIWIIISSEKYPNSLNKELILCPMSIEERKYYLYRHYGSKIMGNMLVLFVLLCVALIGGWINKSGMFFLLMSQLWMNLTTHLHIRVKDTQKEQLEESYGLKGYMANRVGSIII